MHRYLRMLSIALGATTILGTSLYHWLFRRPLARKKGNIRLSGLEDEVKVTRDCRGVPCIMAGNLRDLMFAQGFVHAQDRLWQMDFQRRLASGRLSEIMGHSTVPIDRRIRTLGLRRAAERDLSLLDGRLRTILGAYAAGVSARIAKGRLPLEFTILGYRPAPWSIVDTLVWTKMVSWNLSVNWEAEILRKQLTKRLGPQRATELEGNYLEHWPQVVGAATGGLCPSQRWTRSWTGPSAYEGVGSNGWVVSGERTTTGAPILANDMHLAMNIPCMWYENRLIGGDLSATGVSLPGLPCVLVGHNGFVAWGITNGLADVQDLYLENLRRNDQGLLEYEYQGEWREAQVISEEIRIRGRSTVTEDVVITHHGPIVNVLAPEEMGEQPLALQWVSLKPEKTVRALFGLNRAHNCLELREALRDWHAPPLNIIYADTEGNIGYSLVGKIPIRGKGDGRLPVPGWTGEYEWTGYIPFTRLPHVLNPSKGYIVTANNRVVGTDYPYELGHEYVMGARAKRIIEMIEARNRVDMPYVELMQSDLVSTVARTIAGYLGQLQAPDSEFASVVELMRNWDGQLTADSRAAAIYEVFVRQMLHLLLDQRLGDLAVRYSGDGPTPILADETVFGERAREWMLSMLSQPDARWPDSAHSDTIEELAVSALGEALDFLRTELGSDSQDWSWGKLHTITFAHVLGKIRPLNRILDRGPFPIGGDGTTIWSSHPNHYRVQGKPIIGPGQRFIADLGDLTNSRAVLVPGQSGQPGSSHYDDQVEEWLAGEYHPACSGDSPAAQAASVLRLMPD